MVRGRALHDIQDEIEPVAVNFFVTAHHGAVRVHFHFWVLSQFRKSRLDAGISGDGEVGERQDDGEDDEKFGAQRHGGEVLYGFRREQERCRAVDEGSISECGRLHKTDCTRENEWEMSGERNIKLYLWSKKINSRCSTTHGLPERVGKWLKRVESRLQT